MPDIDVEINGRNYRLACAEGEERRIAALAQRLDALARQATAQAGVFSEMRTLVMAALLAVDAADEAETEAARLRDAAARNRERIKSEMRLAIAEALGALRADRAAPLRVRVDPPDAGSDAAAPSDPAAAERGEAHDPAAADPESPALKDAIEAVIARLERASGGGSDASR